jgi:cellulose synthase/poly-beta-1,6-N-acetylglucosamine synthase-like glycosyltransferase
MDAASLDKTMLALAAFWISFALVFHTFIGYPLLITALARCRGNKAPLAEPLASSTVTVVLAARNEQDRIVPRLENLLASDYPADRLSIILVSDGSTDQSARRVADLNDSRVTLIERDERAGKPACLNLGVDAARSDIIVFSDARQRFDANTISNLVQHFENPKVGAVSGALLIQSSDSAVGGGVDAYWRLEKMIRHAESRWDSCIGCTGAVYAIRRELYEAIPADTLIDDVEIPMRIATRGFRVLYDFDSQAHDSQSLEPAREKIRKQRTLAGNYQMLFRHPGWLFPWRNRLWWQLISHKYLRLAAPFLLITLMASNLILISEPLYQALLWFHGGFYALALLGGLAPPLRMAFFSIPAGFLFLNLMSLRGLYYYLFKSAKSGWDSTTTQPAQKN